MFKQLLEEFAGQHVEDFDIEDDWQGPELAYRVWQGYDDETTIVERLHRLLDHPGSAELTALVVGAWERVSEGESAEAIVKELIRVAPRLPKLRALFLGDITYEECELSWLKLTDVSPLLAAWPNLETFGVRGSDNLAFSPLRHEGLRHLTIESGGLPRKVLRQVFSCELPNLESLKLFLGETQYGFDGDITDLQPLFSGQLFPRLQYLGLMNSEIADEIAAVVVNAPIIDRIHTLDLSLGNLGDEGVRSLRALAGKKNLTCLNISHHYASPQELKALNKALGCLLIADDPQEADDDYRIIMHSE
jgi:hypothetical protein